MNPENNPYQPPAAQAEPIKRKWAIIPSIGRIVHYTLNSFDADAIKKSRAINGTAGNPVQEGDVFPMIITRIWDPIPRPESMCQGQVFLDGNDQYWASSVQIGEGPRSFSWPELAGR